MLPPLKIFKAEQVGPVVVVTPEGDGSAFRYQDVHMEANAVRGHLGKPGNDHLVIDLHKMEYFGSEFIGALVTMAREVRNRQGKAVMCAATPQMLDVLQNMSLFKLWPYHETREAALADVAA